MHICTRSTYLFQAYLLYLFQGGQNSWKSWEKDDWNSWITIHILSQKAAKAGQTFLSIKTY